MMLHPGTKATGVVLCRGAYGPNEPMPREGELPVGPNGPETLYRLATLPAQGVSGVKKNTERKTRVYKQIESTYITQLPQKWAAIDFGAQGNCPPRDSRAVVEVMLDERHY